VKKKKSTSSAIALMKENASLPPPKLKPEPLKIPSYTRPTPKPAPTQVPPPVSAGVQKKKKTNKRPSLSEQLAAIGNSASDLTSQIKKTHNLDGDNHKNNNKPLQKALLAAGAQNFTVGKLTCKFPSPVNFFNDRCTYVFHHPYEPKEINMVMFYADLKNVSVVGKTLKFKIGHPLSEFRCVSFDVDDNSLFPNANCAFPFVHQPHTHTGGEKPFRFLATRMITTIPIHPITLA